MKQLLIVFMMVICLSCTKEAENPNTDPDVDRYADLVWEETNDLVNYPDLRNLKPDELEGKNVDEQRNLISQHSSEAFAIRKVQIAELGIKLHRRYPDLTTDQLTVIFDRRAESKVPKSMMEPGCLEIYNKQVQRCNRDYYFETILCGFTAGAVPAAIVCVSAIWVKDYLCKSDAYDDFRTCSLSKPSSNN
jgi:hypothetical protein